jgi:hypothetical protein
LAKPYRAVVPRKDEKTGKTFWTQIGVAWKRDTGSISVVLDALPIGNEIVLFPPDDGPPGKRDGRSSAQREPEDDIAY